MTSLLTHNALSLWDWCKIYLGLEFGEWSASDDLISNIMNGLQLQRQSRQKMLYDVNVSKNSKGQNEQEQQVEIVRWPHLTYMKLFVSAESVHCCC